MGKIHELLAVEKDLQLRAKKILAETRKLFEAGPALFVGQLRTYQPLEEGGDQFPPEVKPLSATVGDRLGQLQKEYGKYLDLVESKEASNSKLEASASVILDEQVFLPKLPVTILLNLESRLEELRAVYSAIPTNDLTDEWVEDRGQGVWRTTPTVSYRTRKVNERMVLYEATDKHPAQVNLVQVDVREGTWTTVKTSGMISPKDKEQRLERLDTLLMAVQQARQRGNDVEAADLKLANRIFAYIDGGVK